MAAKGMTNMSHDEYQIQRGKILTPSFWVLLTLTVIGFTLIAVRFIWGIGAVSNMSDGYPWGIWITYDVATGTAIACGGYAVAILVYIRNKMSYHPLIRSAVLTSLFGYGLAGFSVMVDVGAHGMPTISSSPPNGRPIRPCSRWRCVSWPIPPCWPSSFCLQF